jgi:hypothetical protein
VITESIGLSIQITHSLLVLLLFVSIDGRAAPQVRQTTREPKFISGHDEHFQSPGFTVAFCADASICIDIVFARLDL